jgi:fructose-6-phosphate aldolase 1
MLEFYLDTADIQQIRELTASLPITGITTNPSILAKQRQSLAALLAELHDVFGSVGRYHVQTISGTTSAIIEEAHKLQEYPYDIVVKIPAHQAGLAAIKQLKIDGISTLATAIYNPQQGMIAALNGADYLAPYLNRIDNLGFDAIDVIQRLQQFIHRYQLPTKLLVASFKNVQQVLQVLEIGVAAVTLPTDIARQWLNTPLTDSAAQQFSRDWQSVFASRLSYQS